MFEMNLHVNGRNNTWSSEGIGSKDKRLPNPIKWTTLSFSNIGSIFFRYTVGFASFMTSMSLTYRRIRVRWRWPLKPNLLLSRSLLRKLRSIAHKAADCLQVQQLQLYWKILHNPNIRLQIIDKITLLIYIAKLAKIID
jgi:hypothetical protein